MAFRAQLEWEWTTNWHSNIEQAIYIQLKLSLHKIIDLLTQISCALNPLRLGAHLGHAIKILDPTK